MKIRRLLVAFILIGAAIIGGVLAFRATCERQAAMQASETARRRLAALQLEAKNLSELAMKAEGGIADWTRKLAELRERVKSKPPGPRPPGLSQLLEFDPSLRAAWDRRVRAKQETFWEPLFGELKIAGEEREDFLRIASDDGDRIGDIVQSADAQGLAMNHPQIEALFEAEHAQTREQLTKRFDEDRANQIYEAWRTMGARQFANALAQRVAFTEPLSAEQANRMARIVAEATPKYAAGSFADNENVDWAVVDRRMREVLSTGQLEAWARAGLRDPQGYRSREELAMEALYEKIVKEEARRTGALAR